jgi:5-methyltetrahydropteroyltriglutamate--homocysteine methyltransferase
LRAPARPFGSGGPPFRAEHMGSLLRPASLKDAFARRRDGKLDAAGYETVLAESIRHAVLRQEEAGLAAITDGELGRSSWFGFFFERMEGFRLEPSAFTFRDERGGRYEWPTCYAVGRMARRGGITIDEYQRLRALTRRLPKVTMPSPSAFHFFRFQAPADPLVYPDPDGYWEDLVAVYRAEIAALGAAGARYVQLDEVPLAMLCDPAIRDQVKAGGEDPAALVARYVGVLARVLRDRPAGMTVGLHLCRGNFRSRWMAAGGYEPVAERLFNEAPVDVFLLEYDSPRAGDFSPLRLMPAGSRVVLGLVSTKSPVLESAATLRRRIDDASRIVPLDRLGLSPQCGFASVAGGNLLTEADQMAKLGLVVDVAREAWG